jgi:hypothetical protein
MKSRPQICAPTVCSTFAPTERSAMPSPANSTLHEKPLSADDLLVSKVAARYLQVSPRTLERWRVEGTGPSFRKLGPGKRAKVLYRRGDLDTWLAGFTYSSTSEYRPYPPAAE